MANYNSTHTGAEVDAAVTKANALPSATEINNKLAKALLTPSVTLQSNELVGVGTNGEQIRVQLGEGVTLEGTTSPYTLKATGGGGKQLYAHNIYTYRTGTASASNLIFMISATIITDSATPFTKNTLCAYLQTNNFEHNASGAFIGDNIMRVTTISGYSTTDFISTRCYTDNAINFERPINLGYVSNVTFTDHVTPL